MNFNSYINYFKTLCEDHVEIGTFKHGMANEVIERKQDSEFQYCLAWLETPEVSINNNEGQTYANRRGALVILDKFDNGIWEQRDSVLNKTEAIALQLIAKMKYDKKQGVLEHINLDSFSMDAVSSLLFNDFETGWRIEFTFESYINVCLDESKFASLA